MNEADERQMTDLAVDESLHFVSDPSLHSPHFLALCCGVERYCLVTFVSEVNTNKIMFSFFLAGGGGGCFKTGFLCVTVIAVLELTL